MATYAFSGGVTTKVGWGDRWKLGFSGTWLAGENWTFTISTADQIFTIGMGQLGGLTPTFCMVLAERVFLAQQTRFNGSANTDPTLWELQDPGAMFEDYRSQFGVEDTIYSIASMQGRLVIIGGRTIQIWAVNADPAQFSLIQVLDNVGTKAKGGTQQLGDYDVLFVDPTGVRSARSRELTLNAFITDIGSPIDDLIQAALVGIDQDGICSVVEPASKRYWVYINGKIYVLSHYPALKITAWSTYTPAWISDESQEVVPFTPARLFVHNGLVYCVTTDGYIVIYGGVNGNTYDGTICSWQIPWLDAKTPNLKKTGERINCAMEGAWQVEAGMDPRGDTDTIVVVPFQVPLSVAPGRKDSNFDEGQFPLKGLKGTHFTAKGYTSPDWKQAATFGAVTFQYNKAQET